MNLHKFSPDNLSTLLNADLTKAKLEQQFQVTFTGSHPNIQAIFILKGSKSTASKPIYLNERSILGKSIRLLFHLEHHYHCLGFLDMYDVSRVIVTEATDPRNTSSLDTRLFSTQDLQSICSELKKVQAIHPGALEATMKGVIAENE